jgi:hypothetical protein
MTNPIQQGVEGHPAESKDDEKGSSAEQKQKSGRFQESGEGGPTDLGAARQAAKVSNDLHVSVL